MKSHRMKKNYIFLLVVFILFVLTAQSSAFVRIITRPSYNYYVPYDPGNQYTDWLPKDFWFPFEVRLDPGCTIVDPIEEFSIEWRGNYYNAKTFIDSPFRILLRVYIDNTIQNIQRSRVTSLSGLPWPIYWRLDANWTQLPVCETMVIRLKGWVKCLHQTAHFDERKEIKFCFQPKGRGAPPPGVPGNIGDFELTPNGTLLWRGCPSGPVTVASQVPPNGFRANGTVVIYQTGNNVRYKMYDSVPSSCLLVAEGNVGNGRLVDVEFDPGQYGATALIQIEEGGAQVYYVHKIDKWGGRAGSTGRIGRPVRTRLPHWVVRWRSYIYLYEFDPAIRTLTCNSNRLTWTGRRMVDTNITGLIVPTSTGGGPVVVYDKNRNVNVMMHKWDTGAKIRTVSLGYGTLLDVDYTLRGSYGAEGVATIRSSEKEVRFCIDLWGEKHGCNRIQSTTNLPPGTVTLPDPPPGFPGSGESPGGETDAADSDGDGFSDAYEQAAGTDPNDPNSLPDIDTSIVLLIDKSGSMQNNNKMESAKKAAVDSLAQIDKSIEIGVMAYSGDCGENFPVVADFSQDKTYLTQQIQTIQPGGGTPMSPALLQAEQFMRNKAHGKKGLIVLLCDGQNDCTPNESDAARQISTRKVPTKITLRPAGRLFQKTHPFRPHQTENYNPFIPAAYAAVQTDPQQQGGPNSIPPGQSQPDVIPEELVPADQTKGGIFVPPPGVDAEENLPPIDYTPPYGSTGVDTTPVIPQNQTVNQDMGIKISTIGFGLQNDPQAQKAMADVAQAGGGQAYGAENLKQLTSAFSQAITQQPTPSGGGGGYVIGTPSQPNWEVIFLVFLGAGSVLLILAILIVIRRRM